MGASRSSCFGGSVTVCFCFLISHFSLLFTSNISSVLMLLFVSIGKMNQECQNLEWIGRLSTSEKGTSSTTHCGSHPRQTDSYLPKCNLPVFHNFCCINEDVTLKGTINTCYFASALQNLCHFQIAKLKGTIHIESQNKTKE